MLGGEAERDDSGCVGELGPLLAPLDSNPTIAWPRGVAVTTKRTKKLKPSKLNTLFCWLTRKDYSMRKSESYFNNDWKKKKREKVDIIISGFHVERIFCVTRGGACTRILWNALRGYFHPSLVFAIHERRRKWKSGRWSLLNNMKEKTGFC